MQHTAFTQTAILALESWFYNFLQVCLAAVCYANYLSCCCITNMLHSQQPRSFNVTVNADTRVSQTGHLPTPIKCPESTCAAVFQPENTAPRLNVMSSGLWTIMHRGDSAERRRSSMIEMSVFTCLVPDNSPLELAVKIDPFDPHSRFERKVHVSLPGETRANGTLFAVVYVHKAGVSPLEDSREVHYAVQLTTYITSSRTDVQKDKEKNPVSHWRPHLSLTVMSEDFTFTKAGLPSDVRRYMRVSQEGRQMMYLPLLMVNELNFRVRDLMEISSSTVQLPLTVSYEGISLRGFRFWVHLQDMVYSLQQFGFTEKNIDEIKEALVGSNLYLLVLTALITALQLICEFLALKNDISSWRKKKSMAGMSRKTVLWRSLGTLLIFLYLLEETSLLVLLPVGLGACVEVWKVFTVFKIQIQCKSNKLHVNKLDEEERKTVEYDTQASRYLSYLVYPLCISGAVFSLAYLRQKSYYSWLISTLVTGVYAFGFLSMAPQLYINHKLKSVSHLQGTVLMYRGVNTLISDLCSCASFFSSSGSFSSSHQLSCFRDELLFFLYLYQRSRFASKPRKREPVPHTKKVKTQ